MFTGLVEEVGSVSSLEFSDDGSSLTLSIHGPKVVSDAALGDSISVNGVCLTVTEFDAQSFSADVMKETLDHSGLGSLQVGSPVNLERALLTTARLGGHIMQGHVDGVGELIHRTHTPNWDVLRFSVPEALDKYIVHKGSIALNGTSLTVSAVEEGAVEVSLIPTTLEETTFGTLEIGDPVNIEVDVVGKYVEKMLEGYSNRS